ncbi:YgiQ family radical SAM protein [Rhodospirillaceae bacterium RKSG073]|nr:YgiQ family radical SAM protein [Curvivirga aplysinae]MTI10216.1 YgiQ family radical SAM protein [Curvivirga aplysinae]
MTRPFIQPDKKLFSYRKYWAHRFGNAPFLPMSRDEMDMLGWDSCDIILITGDAYVDHPSFGMAVIGRVLEAQGFRVGIISQPRWQDKEDFKQLGRPNLFFGITAGNMDSMVNRYTADRKVRNNDSYTPNDEGGKRPDRATLVYTQRCREAFKKTPIVIGGIEASLRRMAHFDYWSNKVRRSILLDAKADILLYGNAERAIVELAHRCAKGEHPADMLDMRGAAFNLENVPDGWTVQDHTSIDELTPLQPHEIENNVIRVPSYEMVSQDKETYAQASRLIHVESNPDNARPLVQAHGDREIWVNPPPIPLSTPEMDGVFDLPYARNPHPTYGDAKIPAWDMIKFSVNIMRGCFGGCSFCSITEHEGRVIQSRSNDSVIREIEEMRDKVKGFAGQISDLGGPTANMYHMNCKDPKIHAGCRKLSCVYPVICKNLVTDHGELIDLYKRARNVQGVKKVSIGSGVRYDLAVESPKYIKELVKHHVGGYLKIAPEHTEENSLKKMMKPGIGTYDRFKELFDRAAKEAGKELYLIPYFIAAHPGTTDEDMMNLALWLKRNNFRADQVQTFTPTPMSLSTAMYYSEKNPLHPVRRGEASEHVGTPRSGMQRKLHKAFLRYHDPKNWPVIRDALKEMGRDDLIGRGKECLVPFPSRNERSSYQRRSSGGQSPGGQQEFRSGGMNKNRGKPKAKTFFTTHAGEGRRKVGDSKKKR